MKALADARREERRWKREAERAWDLLERSNRETECMMRRRRMIRRALVERGRRERERIVEFERLRMMEEKESEEWEEGEEREEKEGEEEMKR